MQIARGKSPTEAGLLSIPMVVGLFLASTLIGRRVTRTGRYKRFMLLGHGRCSPPASALMGTMDERTSLLELAAFMLVLGAGLGMVMQNLVLVVQNTRPPRGHRRRQLADRVLPQPGRRDRRQRARRAARPPRARRRSPTGSRRRASTRRRWAAAARARCPTSARSPRRSRTWSSTPTARGSRRSSCSRRRSASSPSRLVSCASLPSGFTIMPRKRSRPPTPSRGRRSACGTSRRARRGTRARHASARRGVGVIDRREQVARPRIVGARLDADRALPDRRQKFIERRAPRSPRRRGRAASSPASASSVASATPSSSLRSRVSTLPRSGTTVRSGRMPLHHRLPAQRRGADHRAVRQVGERSAPCG